MMFKLLNYYLFYCITQTPLWKSCRLEYRCLTKLKKSKINLLRLNKIIKFLSPREIVSITFCYIKNGKGIIFI